MKKLIKQELSEKGEFAFKVMSAHTITAATVVSQLFIFWISTKGSLFPGVDTLMSIIGTCAEIIAGLYGITLAGYTFFLSRIDALMASDMTLDYIISSVKTRFKYLIWFITYHVLVTLTVTITLMYCPMPANENHAFYYRLFCNEFVLSLSFSIVLILYYSILVIDPNCIEKEAAKLKKKISRPKGANGSVTDFIILYDRIEACCDKMLPEQVCRQIQDNKGKRFEYTIELLREYRPKLRPVLASVQKIHRYYECVVNTSPMTVTQEMCTLARRVLETLDKQK